MRTGVLADAGVRKGDVVDVRWGDDDFAEVVLPEPKARGLRRYRVKWSDLDDDYASPPMRVVSPVRAPSCSRSPGCSGSGCRT